MTQNHHHTPSTHPNLSQNSAIPPVFFSAKEQPLAQPHQTVKQSNQAYQQHAFLIFNSEFNHSPAITEKNMTKNKFSAILTTSVTQKRVSLLTFSAKTALASYLL